MATPNTQIASETDIAVAFERGMTLETLYDGRFKGSAFEKPEADLRKFMIETDMNLAKAKESNPDLNIKQARADAFNSQKAEILKGFKVKEGALDIGNDDVSKSIMHAMMGMFMGGGTTGLIEAVYSMGSSILMKMEPVRKIMSQATGYLFSQFTKDKMNWGEAGQAAEEKIKAGRYSATPLSEDAAADIAGMTTEQLATINARIAPNGQPQPEATTEPVSAQQATRQPTGVQFSDELRQALNKNGVFTKSNMDTRIEFVDSSSPDGGAPSTPRVAAVEASLGP